MTLLDTNYNPAVQNSGAKYDITKFDTSGASSGDVPSYNGTTVVWTPNGSGGLVLPTSMTDATSTTGDSFLVTESTLTTGNGLRVLGTTANFTTGGALFKADLAAATAGNGFVGVTTGAYTGTGLLTLTANSLTTGSLATLSATGQTTGTLVSITGGGANVTTGTGVAVSMGAATAGTGISVTTTGVYAGSNNLVDITGNSATTTTGLLSVSGTGLTSGSAVLITGGGANMTAGGQTVLINTGASTTGQGLQITSTGVYTGLNGIFQATADSATTGTIARINGAGLTSGNALYVVGGGANMVTGGNVANFDMGAGIAGSAVLLQTTGVYTGTTGVFNLTASSATTGVLANIIGTGITTGTLLRLGGTEATLTTGRYISVFDNTLEAFGIGANGHIHTAQTTAPTIAVTQQNGITAAAITAGASDTCGQITTTGTNNNGGDTILQVSFNKTYTAAPKAVLLQGLNASSVIAGTSPYISAITATTFDITIPASASSGATPSWSYLVVA